MKRPDSEPANKDGGTNQCELYAAQAARIASINMSSQPFNGDKG
jgi:hypothetical protein